MSWATKFCNFRVERREGRLGGMREGERRRRGKRDSGRRRAGAAQTPVEAVIPVERGDEVHVRRERPYVAVFDLEVDMGQRFRQARDLQTGEALRRVKRRPPCRLQA